MIKSNGDRYCKNPYFLHSLATHNPSRQSIVEQGSTNYKTISEYGGVPTRVSYSKSKKSKFSEGVVEGYARPPKVKSKRIRPYSAPRHQGL